MGLVLPGRRRSEDDEKAEMSDEDAPRMPDFAGEVDGVDPALAAADPAADADEEEAGWWCEGCKVWYGYAEPAADSAGCSSAADLDSKGRDPSGGVWDGVGGGECDSTK
jgi:hypothetical protein